MALPQPAAASFVEAVAAAMARSGFDLPSVARAWARAMPAVVLVPAFGLRALPAASRGLLGLAFAACVFPASGNAGETVAAPFPIALAAELARGVPVAVAAAVPLWAATMAGGVVDALRGAHDAQATVVVVEGRASPLGVAFSLLASALFLATGGPARVVAALALRPASPYAVLRVVDDLASGIGLAVALAAPLLVAAVVVEVAAALVARAAAPAQVHSLLAPARAAALLAVLGLVFQRLSTALAAAVDAAAR